MRLSELAARLGAELLTNHALDVEVIEIVGAAAVSLAEGNHLVFAESDGALKVALASRAGSVLTTRSLASPSQGLAAPPKSMLIVQHPRLAFARAAMVLRQADAQTGIHTTAWVAGSVILREGVSIGAGAVVREGAVLGAHTTIDAGVVIGAGAQVGAGCHLYPRVVVYPGTVLGERVIVHAGAVLGCDGFGYVRDGETGEYLQFPQQGRLVIEDDVEIGANTTIDRGALEVTRIGRGAKLDNLVHVGHNVDIGRNVVIAAQTGISGSCVIGDGAVLGGQVGMGDHVEIGAGVILGGGAGILPGKRVHGPGALFWGTPARPVKEYLRQLATLARLTKRAR